MSSTVILGDVLEKPSCEALSVCPTDVPPRKIDYKKEVIFYFFNSMLEAIVDSWDAFADINYPDSIASANVARVEPDDWRSVELEPVEVNAEVQGETDSRYSFFKSDSDLQHKKHASGSRVHRKTQSGRKSRKLTRKRVTQHIPVPDESAHSLAYDTWIIEPVAEHVVIGFKNGNRYEGPVFGKLMHGCGKFVWADGTTYIGNFSNGEMTGEGSLALPDKSSYSGGFMRGYRHLVGVMTVAASGALYRGGWRAGCKHGRGWQMFRANDWYDGEWSEDAMSGTGIRQYPSGARYQGQWGDGKRDGTGCAVMNNNDFYKGEWSEGKRRGYGEYTWCGFYNKTFSVPVQSSYIGSWDKNMMHGIGLVNFGTEGGARYAGCFENNEKHGAGVIICENGSTYESNPLFRKDKPVHLTYTGSFNISADGESFRYTDATSATISDYVNSSFVSDMSREKKPSVCNIQRRILPTAPM